MSFIRVFALIINSILVLVILITLYYYYHFNKISSYKKRLNKNDYIQKEDNSNLFDYLINFYHKIRDFINNILSKSYFLSDYSKYYIKYTNKDDPENSNPMTYITIKMLTGIFIIILLLISAAYKVGNANLMSIVLGFLIGFFVPDLILIGRNKLIRKDMENEMLKAVTIMNNSFKVGHSIMQTIDITENELSGNLKDEFKKISRDLHYGLDLETVFKRFSKRVNMQIATYMATSLTILNKTGGNIIKVFSSIERTIFDNRKLEEELKNLSAPAKLLYRILVCVPLVFILLIYVLDPTYFAPLFSNPLGFLIIFVLLVIYTLYIIIVKRIIRLKEY
ncbi:MAG: type II secretion system F family protein [Bacilli bacterium]|nr:type II secretion system F family protein [Bacilli bacterium]